MKKDRIISITAILLLVLSLSFIFGCASKSPQSLNENKSATADKGEGGYLDNSGDTASSTTSSAFTTNESLADRKVIFTASVGIETTEYDKSIKTLEKMIDDFGAYIQESNVETSTPYQSSSSLRTAIYTIRVPADKFKSFLSMTGNIGNIILNTSKGEDVTDTYFDTKAHIDTLSIQEDRLTELLKKAMTLKDILDLEDRLSQVRYEIEQLTGNLNALSSLIALSTATIKIDEVETITSPQPEGFWAEVSATFTASIKALATTLRGLSLVLVAIFPFIFTICVILLVVYVIYRCSTRSKRKIAKDKKSNII